MTTDLQLSELPYFITDSSLFGAETGFGTEFKVVIIEFDGFCRPLGIFLDDIPQGIGRDN